MYSFLIPFFVQESVRGICSFRNTDVIGVTYIKPTPGQVWRFHSYTRVMNVDYCTSFQRFHRVPIFGRFKVKTRETLSIQVGIEFKTHRRRPMPPARRVSRLQKSPPENTRRAYWDRQRFMFYRHARYPHTLAVPKGSGRVKYTRPYCVILHRLSVPCDGRRVSGRRARRTSKRAHLPADHCTDEHRTDVRKRVSQEYHAVNSVLVSENRERKGNSNRNEENRVPSVNLFNWEPQGLHLPHPLRWHIQIRNRFSNFTLWGFRNLIW